MHVGLTLKPGEKGTKKLVRKYGDRLVRVRYRYDEKRKKRYKTVELIVEEVDWEPPLTDDEIVEIRIEWGEVTLGREVRRSGGTWNAEKRVWELRYDQVKRLNLKDRMVNDGQLLYSI